jgi:hypothetical protein
MFDHVSLQCDDLTASRAFYATVLAPSASCAIRTATMSRLSLTAERSRRW